MADTDAAADDDLPDTIPDPRSMPFVPHVRIATRPPPPSGPRERMFDDELAPPSA